MQTVVPAPGVLSMHTAPLWLAAIPCVIARSEAAAFADRLGREERVEGALGDLLGHADAVVAAGHADVVAARQAKTQRRLLVDRPILDR